jgi:hypothetical protein
MVRIRFTLRCMMAIIVGFAMCFAMAERHLRFTRLALTHESRRPKILVGDLLRGSLGTDSSGRPIADWEVELHRQMSRKYRYAASHPWLLVPPDPQDAQFKEDYYKLKRSQYESRERGYSK